MTEANDLLALLQKWYDAQCDGDWEHGYGVKLETLDNPGWYLTVDLSGTEAEDLIIEERVTKRDDGDWISYSVQKQQFSATGGNFNLSEMIRAFLVAVGNHPVLEVVP